MNTAKAVTSCGCNWIVFPPLMGRTIVLIFLFVLSNCTSFRGTEPVQVQEVERPKRLLDTPADFTGWSQEARPVDEFEEIRIGLFGPDETGDTIAGSIYLAARMAISELNSAGGLDGVPFELIQRWDDDPWRGGSKEMVRLVYRDSVWAVIGSIDGAATHIAEQVITKAWVPLLSPVSADPTLTYINIPWIFRLPPDDRKQAEVIIRDGIKALSLIDVGLITDTDHDGRIFAGEMLSVMKTGRVPPVFHFQITPGETDYEDIFQRIRSFDPDGVVIRLPREELLELVGFFDDSGMDVRLFVPWIPGLQCHNLEGYQKGQLFCVYPFAEEGNHPYEAFKQSYQARYGRVPSPGAAYTYDAVKLIGRALQESGLSRAGLREVISDMEVFTGITGPISWDNGGGNRTRPVLLRKPITQ